MHTAAATRAMRSDADLATVTSVHELAGVGWTVDRIRSQVRAGRWQRVGRAVVRHNAELTRAERERAALILLGPRSALTSFTALAHWGLTGWEREPIHVLVPRGAHPERVSELDLRVHYTDNWRTAWINGTRGLHRPGPAAVLAATSFGQPRPACGVLAAVVQQRLAPSHELVPVVESHARIRHRRILLAAAHDIAQGAQALSEIDLVDLCRRAHLPVPARQAVRKEPDGRRRYLDAEWVTRRGRRLIAEIDGALHLAAPRWWADQLRQNELAIAGDTVLRFPSIIVRCEQALVIDQLRRGLDDRLRP